MVDDHLFLHELYVSPRVPVRGNSRYLCALLVDHSFNCAFQFLVEVEVLEVVDDGEMVDELSALAQEGVAGFLVREVFMDLF